LSKLVARIQLSETKKADLANAAVAGILKVKGPKEHCDTLSPDDPEHIAFRKPKNKFTGVTTPRQVEEYIRGQKLRTSMDSNPFAPGNRRAR
jgi:hypothetical protein